jgi:hypothetical protein
MDLLGSVPYGSVPGVDTLNRTNGSAVATIGTDFSIDHVDVTFTNALNRALIDTSSTSGTLISNHVSQGVHLLQGFKSRFKSHITVINRQGFITRPPDKSQPEIHFKNTKHARPKPKDQRPK